MHDTLTIEQKAFDDFMQEYKNGTKYRGCRMGQAFHNHFNLHRMTQREDNDHVYQMLTEEFTIWARNNIIFN